MGMVVSAAVAGIPLAEALESNESVPKKSVQIKQKTGSFSNALFW